MTNYHSLRHNMVRTQIMTVDVTDQRIRAAMAKIPRESFAPESRRQTVYADTWIEVSAGRWLSPAGVLATLLQKIAITSNDAVLVIAPGTGYACAVIAQLAAAVVGLEDDRGRARDASTRLALIGIDNAIVESGTLAEGLPEQGPYDAIWVDGVVEFVPEAWFAQLAAGGRLVAVVREPDLCIWRVYQKSARGDITVADCGTRDQGCPVLSALTRPASFVF